jgi:hypothetical protein
LRLLASKGLDDMLGRADGIANRRQRRVCCKSSRDDSVAADIEVREVVDFAVRVGHMRRRV